MSAATTFLPRQVKNCGGSPSRKAFDHSQVAAMQVARSFTWSGSVLAVGSSFDPVAKGASDDRVKLLWHLGFIDMT